MQDSHGYQNRKVVIVGAGAVGATYAYALAQSGLADEIALVDMNQDLVKGQVLDLQHGEPFFPSVAIHAGSQQDYKDAQLIVITAGAAQKEGETRLHLLQKNTGIMKNIIDAILAEKSRAVIVVVSNPVDVLTYVALKRTGWERGRVIGSGTVLDSSRLRSTLSRNCGVDAHNVHAYMLGEHGDSEFAAWSLTHVAGMPIDQFCPTCGHCEDWTKRRKQIEQEVRDSAYHIINYKGATHFAVGMALVRISEAILRGQNSVLTVSTLLEGEFGLQDVCLSVPCIVSENGVSRVIEGKLFKEEQKALEYSAGILQKAITELDL